MKKALSILAAFLASAAFAADAALLKLTPREYTAVISADVRGLLKNPEFGKIAAKPAAVGFLADAEKFGVRLDSIHEAAVFNWDDCWYGLFRIADADALRRKLEEHRNSGKTPNIVTETAAGRKVYRFRDPKRLDARHRKKELCTTFLDDGTVVVAKAVELEKFLKARRADAAETERLAGNRAEVWAEYRRRPGKTSDDDDETFDARLKSARAEIMLAGDAKKAVEIRGAADLVDHESAESMSMTLPGLLSFFAGLVFSDDPEGGDMFVKALRSEARGNTLHFSLHASEELFARLLRALENFLGDGKNRGGANAKKLLPGGRAK